MVNSMNVNTKEKRKEDNLQILIFRVGLSILCFIILFNRNTFFVYIHVFI